MAVYSANDRLSPRDAHIERKKYKEGSLQNIGSGNVIDLWYETPNYGLLNANFEPVYLADDSTKYFSGIADSVRVSNFVVDAFLGFRQEYLDLVTQNITINFPPFIDMVIPKRGFEPFEEKYSNYSERMLTHYVSEMIRLDPEPSYSGFEEALFRIIERSVYDYPITRSGFLLSSHCSINVSGLYVELGDLDYSRDFDKGKILSSIDFYCFLENANNHGFAVDKNSPWRLIADLANPKMQEYIEAYSRENTYRDSLDRLYLQKSQNDDLYSLTNFVLAVYNRFVEISPIFYDSFQDPTTGLLNKRSVTRPLINFSENGINEQYWLDLLLRVRYTELGNLENYERDRSELVDVHAVSGPRSVRNPLQPAIDFIGRKCSSKIRSIYEREIDSNTRTTLSDYYNI